MKDPSSQTRGADDVSGLQLGSEFRMTKQRREIYDVLMEKRDHPTASEVFDRVKARIPGISLATVYNCLETLSSNDLVKQVNMDREPSRYCPNLKEHAHFFCDLCGSVTDVLPNEQSQLAETWDLPTGSVVSKTEVVIKGVCPSCAD